MKSNSQTAQPLSQQRDLWNDLNCELDNFSRANLSATFWWRDDDAVKAGAKLDHLIDQSSKAKAPLLLAVIPAKVEAGLQSAISRHDHVWIGQHGYAHINHAPRSMGLGAWELGLHRGEQAVLQELIQGREILSKLFEKKFVPVVVPPWNKIDPALFKPLASYGYKGVSAFGARDRAEPANGLIQINCHCDPIKWKGGARFTGEEKALTMIIDHLLARRTGKVSSNEPTGLLTHHIDMDEPAWHFVAALGECLNQHPATRWCDPGTMFSKR